LPGSSHYLPDDSHPRASARQPAFVAQMAPKAGGDEDETIQEQLFYLEKKIKILQHRIMYKEEQAANSRKCEAELRQRVQELDQCFEKEGDKCREHTGEMSRQYREMQDSFNERIEVLQKQVASAKSEIEEVNKEIERVRVEKDEKIRQKDAEIKMLTHKMESMAFEFADMLKETLDKMSQRIEVTHNSWDRDATKPPLMNRLKAFSLNDAPGTSSGGGGPPALGNTQRPA